MAVITTVLVVARVVTDLGVARESVGVRVIAVLTAALDAITRFWINRVSKVAHKLSVFLALQLALTAALGA